METALSTAAPILYNGHRLLIIAPITNTLYLAAEYDITGWYLRL